MNSITQKTFILAGMTLLILLITGCPQPHGKGIAPKIPPAETPSPGGNVNSGTKPGSSSSGANTGSGSNSATNPGSPGTVQEEKIDITEEELLTALSLTRGSQSAAEVSQLRKPQRKLQLKQVKPSAALPLPKQIISPTTMKRKPLPYR